MYSEQEIHINGDIAFAVQQYLYMTKDVEFLNRSRGYEMISELAKYWASRVVYNKTSGNYEIDGRSGELILIIGCNKVVSVEC